MKKMKKIMAAAIAMMTFSTAAAVTGTVAWFTANNIVTASNMTVTATSEQGIVIAAYDGTSEPLDSAYTDNVNAVTASKDNLLPTWSNNGTVWYHANSKQSANGQIITDAGYKNVSNETNNYYLFNQFKIKSTGATQDVYVKAINVTRAANQSAQDYDEALRVLVTSDDVTNALVFAPFGTHSGSEQILASASATDDLESNASFTFASANDQILDDVSTTAEVVKIYIWYDGEDAACKSDNIPADAFNTLTVSVQFSTDNQ